MQDAVTVTIDLARVRQNAEAILRLTGVPIIAVVKADAYGLGAGKVAEAIGDLVDAFYVFDESEAIAARLWDISKRRIIALNTRSDADGLISNHIHPVVWSVDRAAALKRAHPVLSIDTGQQRFAAGTDIAGEVFHAGDCPEAMTHAVRLDQVAKFRQTIDGFTNRSIFRHAAGSALISNADAWLEAVRPGLALYENAMRVTARLVEVRDSTGPAGYTGFISPRFGIILAGYSTGLRPGFCLVNGVLRRVLEVGMQSAFVELGTFDKIGDEVVILDAEGAVNVARVSEWWGCSHQEVLVRASKLA